MRKIIFTRPDGGISVMTPALGSRLCRAVIAVGDVPLFRFKEAIPVERVLRKWYSPLIAIEWDETEEEFLVRIAAQDVPVTLVTPYTAPNGSVHRMLLLREAQRHALAYSLTDYRVVEDSTIPADRTFRNALKATAAGVEIDMPKARQIHRERLRVLRAPLLVAADLDYMRADEANNQVEKARIAARKQALRDLTDDPAIAGARTAEELKAVLPDVLTAP